MSYLGNLIDRLKDIDRKYPDLILSIGVENPHSWRGVYSELGVEKVNEPTSVKKWIEVLEEALGSTYVGYKGGEYKMYKHTPVHIDKYGQYTGENELSINLIDALVREARLWWTLEQLGYDDKVRAFLRSMGEELQ